MRIANANALAEQNRQLLERLRALESGQAQPPAGQGQPPAQTGTQPGQPPQVEPVRLTVPPQWFDALNSDDPATAKQALDGIVSAVATNAVQTALQRVDAVLNQRFQTYEQAAETSRAIQTQEEQFYAAFPALKEDLYRPLIEQETQALYRELPQLAWNQDTINAIGTRVTNKLKALGIPVGMVPGAQPQGDGGGAPPAGQRLNGQQRPAPMLDASTRGGGAPLDDGNFIASTLG